MNFFKQLSKPLINLNSYRDKDMISKHLSYGEVTKSATALKFGINNIPSEKHLTNLKIHAKNIFEPIRKHFKAPIYVSSGYRSKKLNSIIGGSKSSQHCKGQALDLDQDYRNSKITNEDIFYFVKDELDFDQLIWEFGDSNNPGWVHVSYNPDRENQRKQVLVATKSKGKTKYVLWENY